MWFKAGLCIAFLFCFADTYDKDKDPNYVKFTPESLIKHYNLEGHIEGGYFNEFYRSKECFRGFRRKYGFVKRAASTAIYYLIVPGSQSALHRTQSDEVWHHYMGGPIQVTIIHPDGRLEEPILGKDIMNGEAPAIIVKGKTWFGARLIGTQDYWSFLGVTVAPGFDYDDFEFGNRTELLQKYPQHEQVIRKLT